MHWPVGDNLYMPRFINCDGYRRGNGPRVQPGKVPLFERINEAAKGIEGIVRAKKGSWVGPVIAEVSMHTGLQWRRDEHGLLALVGKVVPEHTELPRPGSS